MGAMNAEEIAQYKGVYVFAQQVDNELSNISFELIGEGKRLAEKLGTDVTAPITPTFMFSSSYFLFCKFHTQEGYVDIPSSVIKST